MSPVSVFIVGGQGELHEMMLMKLSCLLAFISLNKGAEHTGRAQTKNKGGARYHLILVISNVPALDAILPQAFQCLV